MNLQDVRDNGNWHSEKLSEVNRQLAYAGIAVVWIFKNGSDDAPRLPDELFAPLCLLGLGLLFDLSHYFSSTIIWKCILWDKEKKIPKEKFSTATFRIPASVNYLSYSLLIMKVSCVGIGYLLLVKWIAQNWGLW